MTELSFVILPIIGLMYLSYGDSAEFRTRGLNQKMQIRGNKYVYSISTL